MTVLLQLLVKTQRSSFDIKIVYQRKNNSYLAYYYYYTTPIFTVANMVTRVDTDDCNSTPSKLTQYAMELLSSTLAQLGSDTHTQGKVY